MACEPAFGGCPRQCRERTHGRRKAVAPTSFPRLLITTSPHITALGAAAAIGILRAALLGRSILALPENSREKAGCHRPTLRQKNLNRSNKGGVSCIALVAHRHGPGFAKKRNQKLANRRPLSAFRCGAHKSSGWPGPRCTGGRFQAVEREPSTMSTSCLFGSRNAKYMAPETLARVIRFESIVGRIWRRWLGLGHGARRAPDASIQRRAARPLA